jgi:hypothetical protein
MLLLGVYDENPLMQEHVVAENLTNHFEGTPRELVQTPTGWGSGPDCPPCTRK